MSDLRSQLQASVAMIKPTDQYQWWRDQLAGAKQDISADRPQSGFYKMRDKSRDGAWVPVAIWRTETAFNCRVGNDTRDPVDVWTWCAGNPVSKADAQFAFEKGSWPGDVAIGNNSGDLSLAAEIDDAATIALEWLTKNGITNQTSMDTAANHRTKLQDLSKKADKERDDKVRPHLTAQREINAEYKPIVEKADSAAKTLRDALSRYMAAEEAKARAIAQEAARAENERRQAEYHRQQEAALAAAAAAKTTAPAPPPPPAPEIVTAEPVRLQAGGQRGKKASLREVKRFAIADYAAALTHCKNHPDVMAAVEKVCFAQARAGATVPGVTQTIEQVAV